MKTQLLEDIEDRYSVFDRDELPQREQTTAPVPTPARSVRQPVPRAVTGVWKFGMPRPASAPIDEAPTPPSPAASKEAVPEVSPTVQLSPSTTVVSIAPPIRLSGPEPSRSRAEFDFAARPELMNADAAANPFSREKTWFDRWGFRALAWGTAVGSLALGFAGAMWLGSDDIAASMRENAVSSANAVAVAQDPPPGQPVLDAPFPPPSASTEAPALLVASVMETAPAPVATPAVAEPVAAPIENEPVIVADISSDQEPAVIAPLRPRSPIKKVKSTSRPKVAKAALEPARKKPVASRVLSARPIAMSPVTYPQSELLEACQSYGYSARQCERRGCMVTKFGLACRGR
jgi:hypothetical protein